MRRPFAIAAVTVLVLAGLSAGGLYGIGRGAEHLAAEVVIPRVERRLGAEITFSSIRAGLGTIVVDGAVVSIPAVPELELTVEAVRVGYAVAPLALGRLEIGQVVLEGPRAGFRARDEGAARRVGAFVRGLRAVREGPAGQQAARVVPTVVVSGGEVVIEDPRGVSVVVSGVRGELVSGSMLALAAEGASIAAFPPQGGELVSTGEIFLSGHVAGPRPSLDSVRIERPAIRLSLGARAEELRAASRALRAVAEDFRGSRSAGTAEETPVSRAYFDLAAVEISEGRVDLLRPGADAPALSLVELDGQLRAGSATEPPSLALAGRADPGGGSVRFAAAVVDGAPRLQLELASFRPGDLAADISRRGVALDRSSVVDADLVLTLEDGRVRFRGEVSTDGLSLRGRLLADEPVDRLRLNLAATGSAALSGEDLVLERARARLGGLELILAGHAGRGPSHYEVDLTVELTPTGCADALTATPPPLRDRLDGLMLEGVLSARGRLVVDSRRLEETVLELSVQNGCRAIGTGRLSVARLEGPFIHRVVLPEGEAFELETGPGTAAWAPLAEISPYLVAAVMTTEDGRFWTHEGFSLPEIRRALVRNLADGRPRFGASTITMQLARNLYLSRGRTVSRKLQEAVLTWYLEQQLTKDQILALYLNVIEFGPRIFGVRQAAMHYFGRRPDDLSPREAVFLAKLLPNPVARHAATFGRGELSPRWESMLDRTLEIMRERRHLSAEELEAARTERVSFHAGEDPLPPRRFWRTHGIRLGDGFDAVVDPWDEEDDGFARREDAGEARLPAPADLDD